MSDTCTSTTAPEGKGDAQSLLTTSDGCQWRYWVDITYSSLRSYMPTQIWDHGPQQYPFKSNYKASLCNDKVYEAGMNGEANSITTQAHFDYTDDINYGESAGGIACVGACFHIVIAAAPGESFLDKVSSTDPLKGYDPSKGVAIHSSFKDSPTIGIHDNYVDVIGLQVKSDHNSAYQGIWNHSNNTTIRNSILEGGEQEPVVGFDSGPCVLANSLVISHSTVGVVSKYPAMYFHNTIVNADHVPGSFGIIANNQWYFEGGIVPNTALFGFTHGVATRTSEDVPSGIGFWSTRSTHNVTDTADTDGGANDGGWADFTVVGDRVPGSMYKVSAQSAFVAWGSDWRPAGNSRLIKGGGCLVKFKTTAEPILQAAHGRRCMTSIPTIF